MLFNIVSTLFNQSYATISTYQEYSKSVSDSFLSCFNSFLFFSLSSTLAIWFAYLGLLCLKGANLRLCVIVSTKFDKRIMDVTMKINYFNLKVLEDLWVTKVKNTPSLPCK